MQPPRDLRRSRERPKATELGLTQSPEVPQCGSNRIVSVELGWRAHPIATVYDHGDNEIEIVGYGEEEPVDLDSQDQYIECRDPSARLSEEERPSTRTAVARRSSASTT